jgi:hypothetical protein
MLLAVSLCLSSIFSVFMRYSLFILLFFLFYKSPAQTLYFYTDGPPYPPGFWRIELDNCEICPAFSPDIAYAGGQTNDQLRGAVLLPDGDLVTLRGVGSVNDPAGGFLRYNPPSPTRILTQYGPVTYQGVCSSPSGTIYLSTETTLYTFDPTNNTVTTVGNYPAALSVIYIFFQNGTMYGLGNYTGSSAAIFQINPSNPSLSTQVGLTNPGFYHPTTASNGLTYGYVGLTGTPPFGFYQLSAPSGTLTPICVPPVPPPYFFGIGSVRALTVSPPTQSSVELPCLCLALTAEPLNQSLNVCEPNEALVPFGNNAQPDFNDIVRYILYTNPNNPMGSILQQNTSPNFSFSPPIQTNTPYYVAQVIGNSLNGNVDPADPCIALSDPTLLTWRPKPTLSALTTTAGELCPGACATLSIELTGTPPFAYSWQVQQGTNVITPLQVVFNVPGNQSNFQACVPSNAAPGTTNVVICGILDNFCGNP